MSSYMTSDTLIASIVRRTHIPVSQFTFENDDLLAFANEEMLIGLVPSIMKLHEEFYVYSFNIPLVSNQSRYEIPNRALGEKVRSVFYQDLGGNLQEMARILPSDLPFYQNRSGLNLPRAFYMENNNIVLIPDISAGPQGQLVCRIFLRPNQLVDATRVAVVQSINTTTGDIIVDSVPSVFALSSPCDFVQINHGHKTKGLDVSPVAINSTLKTINFAPGTIPTDLNVGDHITLAGETIIPQMPDELHSVLAQRVACRCLEAQKDMDGLQAANAKLQEMEEQLGVLIDNRTEGQPQKINNLRSALRSGKFRRRRSTY